MDRLLEKMIFEPPAPGTVLYLPGLPGAGSRIYDRSPYGNHGTITGATWKRLPSGLWYTDHDGTDDYIQVPHAASISFGLTDSFTIVVWVNLTAKATRHQILMKRITASTDYEILVETIAEGSTARFLIWEGGNLPIVESTTVVADSTWHLLVAIRDVPNDRLQLYVDGTQEGGNVTDTTTSTITNTDDLYIGSRQVAGSKYHAQGGIALPRIFNVALTEFDAMKIFKDEKSLFGVF